MKASPVERMVRFAVEQFNAYVVESSGEGEGTNASELQHRMIRSLLRLLVTAEAERIGSAAGAAQLRLFGGEGQRVVLATDDSSPSREQLELRLLEHWRAIPKQACPALAELGHVYELLLGYDFEARSGFIPGQGRKQTGSYYTPDLVARSVVARAFARADWSLVPSQPLPCVCDPALGAGAFLLAAADWMVARLGDTATNRQRIIAQSLYGMDLSPTAVALAEALLWLWAGAGEAVPPALQEHLRVGDALGAPAQGELFAHGSRSAASALSARDAFPEVAARSGFDAVVGNPPWVAFAGRAAKPLPDQVRTYYRQRFAAFSGYPSLHGLFVEVATELAPTGIIALLVPSPIADLAGYRATRTCLRRRHQPVEPMQEFGQDAFEAVVQPCFGLVAEPRLEAEVVDLGSPWRLEERQRAGAQAETLAVPEVLDALRARAPWPRELFGELGFQSNRRVTERLLLRAPEPCDPFTMPLLEGRNVKPFVVGSVGLYLDARAEALALAGVTLKPPESYQRAALVVRQTAKTTIAARHNGLPFRNSLLAGYEHSELDPDLLVGLLNSTLYRSLHLAGQRDARQAAFPQVKVAHLRALPSPPPDASQRGEIIALSRAASQAGPSPDHLRELDRAVFDLFEVSSDARQAVHSFLQSRAPELTRV